MPTVAPRAPDDENAWERRRILALAAGVWWVRRLLANSQPVEPDAKPPTRSPPAPHG